MAWSRVYCFRSLVIFLVNLTQKYKIFILISLIKHKVDIREETPESTTMRILEALRILRYSVPVEPDEL